jgi:hypothetical protein
MQLIKNEESRHITIGDDSISLLRRETLHTIIRYSQPKKENEEICLNNIACDVE